jgi:hypothetical protein
MRWGKGLTGLMGFGEADWRGGKIPTRKHEADEGQDISQGTAGRFPGAAGERGKTWKF